jgi:hypothetical protein
MPFVPQDMSPDEKTLLASISAQMVAHRGATTPQQVQAARSEAQQVAGEMIWAQRAETMPPEPEEPLNEELTAYYGRLAAAAAENRAMYEDGEPEYYELPERQPKG